MLDQARWRVIENDWKNVELVCADAAQYEFPADLGGVLTTFALILIPQCGTVVANACRALAPGRRMAVLDMAWPASMPLWWRHVLFFLRSYGVTEETLKNKPWKIVQNAMEENLTDLSFKKFWYGFFYLTAGKRGAEA